MPKSLNKQLIGRVISRNKNDCLVSEISKSSSQPIKMDEVIKLHFSKKNTEVFSGDYVLYESHSILENKTELKEDQKIGHQGKLVEVIKPKNQFFRQDSYGNKKIIARNLSQIALVVSVKPKVNFLSIDATLALCALNGQKLLIVVNKSDLAQSEAFFQGIERYQSERVEIVFTSIFNPASLEKLEQKLLAQSTLFFGKSGVGKSSLIQSFFPNQKIKTQALVHKSSLGKHTTTQAWLYQNEKFELFDTPGMGNETISYFAKEGLAKLFVEFIPYLNDCKFRNCNHLENDFSCALLAATKEGKIHPKRLEQYQRLVREFCFKENLY